MNKSILSLAIAAVATFAVSSASAYVTYSGVDMGGPESALVATPNSSGAETSFRSQLIGVGTETFEGLTTGSVAPLVLNFGASGTATLQGGSGRVSTLPTTCNSNGIPTTPPPTTNCAGRYSVPGGTKWFDTVAGGTSSFNILFSQDVAAFGFYGIDIGDFNGTVLLEFLDSSNTVVGSLNVPTAPVAMANASVLYFGAIAQNNNELFRSIRFVTTGGADFFGFDSLTIGAQNQIGTNVPEPTSLALIGAAMLGFGLSRRRTR